MDILKIFNTTEDELKLAKALSKVNQYLANETEQGTKVGFEYNGQFISNIFLDETEHTELTFEEAVSKYGTENVRKFYHDVLNDYDVWLEAERQEKEELIRKYTGLTDSNGKRIFEGDTVSFCGMEGKVVFCAGAFGIATKETIDYDQLCREIAEWCGADNTEHFSYCDNFISFWELIWNFGHDDNSCPSVTVIGNIVN